LGTPLNTDVNTKNFCKNVTLNKIVCFFEDKNLRYQIKKSDRTKFINQYKNFYNDYVYIKTYLLGNRVAKGGNKIVYKSKTNPNEVIKIFQHRLEKIEIEKQNYNFLIYHNLRHLTPTMQFFNFYCIAEKASSEFEIVDNQLIRNIISDSYITNFGSINDRPVCLDIKTLDRNYIQKNLSELQNLRHD